MRQTAALIALALLFAATAISQEAADRKALAGKWTPVSAELAGAKLPEAQLAVISLTIADANYLVQVGKAIDKGTLKIDSAKKPRAMDIIGTDGPNKGKTMLAIYEIDKDTLKICYDLEGKNRPTDFTSSKEKPHFLVVYRRAKP